MDFLFRWLGVEIEIARLWKMVQFAIANRVSGATSLCELREERQLWIRSGSLAAGGCHFTIPRVVGKASKMTGQSS